MSKPLDVSLRLDDLVRYAGELTVAGWIERRKREVLEARVDELDPPEPDIAPDVSSDAQDDFTRQVE